MSVLTIDNEAGVEQQPISSADFLNRSTELLSVVLFVYQPEARKLSYNTAQIKSVLGYNMQLQPDADSFDVFDLLHPDDIDCFRNVLNQAGALNDDIICRLRYQDGHYGQFIFRAKMIMNAAGRNIFIYATSTQSPFAQYKNQNEALKDKLHDLQYVNKELEEFAYVASHDLQEPLRKITTFSSRLNEKFKASLGDEGGMYLDRIVASANNMRMFIESLLDFSRVSRVEAVQQFTDLNFIMKQVKADLELAIEETNCVISSDKLPSISASPTQMKQLFTNIVSNAIKFRKTGSTPEIQIKATELPKDECVYFSLDARQKYYKISVIDNGIGFAEEYASKIFKAFQRLHGKSEFPGTGLGLAICKKIVDQHAGRIFAEGEPGNGACFNIILPVGMPGN